jgi:hypothetical protein
MIKINFEDTYEPIKVGEDLSFMTFYSEVKNAQKVLLKIEISSLGDPLLPNVFNMAFGPLNENGDIDDSAKVNHQNNDKVFSTILLFSLIYLQSNPQMTIGIDGSNDIRAYLYHRMFLTNREYLDEYFVTIGVDWYVKLLRNDTIEVDINGVPYFKPKPEPFDYKRLPTNLYRYYMYKLKQ